MRNKVELIGRVGRVTVHEKNATFSLATTYTRRSDGEKHMSTEWHNLVAFGSDRDLVKNFVSPGRFLHVEGHSRRATGRKAITSSKEPTLSLSRSFF